MPLQLRIRSIGVEQAGVLWAELRRRAPGYFERCGLSHEAAFAVWAVSNNVYWCPLDHGGLFLTDWKPGLCVRIHPVVWGKKLATDREYAAQVLSALHKTCRVGRVEVLVPLDAPAGLCRWCARAGLAYEGVMRKAVHYGDKITDGALYAHTED